MCSSPVHRADAPGPLEISHPLTKSPIIGSCGLKWGDSSVMCKQTPNSQFISVTLKRRLDCFIFDQHIVPFDNHEEVV